MARLVNNDHAFKGESRSIRRALRVVVPGPQAPIKGIESDFDRVLFWGRLAVAQSRKNPERFAREAETLLALRHREGFLAEFMCWRESDVFTLREKIAIEWGEIVARGKDRKEIGQIWKKARDHFAASEIIQLNLSVQAINDWFDNLARLETYVLIIQPDISDGGLPREPGYERRSEGAPIYAASTEDAMRLLDDERRPRIASKLAAIVIDVHLPRISASELMESIKHRPGLEHLPVVVTTSSSQPEDIEECAQLKLKLEADGAVAITAASVSEAFSHIAEQNRARDESLAAIGRPPEPLRLLQVYERLRAHFDAKK